jgi:hypothetical protein
MSQRQHSTLDWIVRWFFAAVLICFFSAFIWSIAASHTEDQLSRKAYSDKHAEEASNQIKSACIIGGSVSAKCVEEIIESAREARRDESDLVAQRGMERWAFWMCIAAVVTLTATFVGVYYVRNTLLETRRIGQAQVRAYLTEDGIVFKWSGTSDISHPSIVSDISTSWFNTGQSPARGCGMITLIHLVDGDDRGKPIAESISALDRQQLGYSNIAAQKRLWCGGGSLDGPETSRGWPARLILLSIP